VGDVNVKGQGSRLPQIQASTLRRVNRGLLSHAFDEFMHMSSHHVNKKSGVRVASNFHDQRLKVAVPAIGLRGLFAQR
jgi:hypothetical protein